MDPSYQQRLREEVIYLHSLWHQGPPTHNPNPRPNNPSRNHLHITNTTPFKTKSNKTKPQPMNQTRPVSIDYQPQHKALQSCREFFTELGSSDDEESEDDDVFEEGNEDYLMDSSNSNNNNNNTGDDDDDDTNYEESEEFKFLLNLFLQDNELRCFYERRYESEEFCCLVCGGVGEKVGKRFKGCVGLVQHSISVAKTKRKRAHRAFSHVVCRVLGWDVDKWPAIVLKGEPLSRSLANSGHTQSPLTEGGGNKHVENLDNGVSSIEANKEEVTGCQVRYSSCNENHVALNSDVKDNVSEFSKFLNSGDRGKKLRALLKKSNQGDHSEGSVPSPGIQWPCGWHTLNSETAPVTHTASSSIALGWSTSMPQKTSVTLPVSAEEQVRFAAYQLQQKVLEACREFFVKPTGSDSDEDDNEDEDDGDLMDEDELEECNEFKFFLRVFTENSELRSYYENNHEGGDFCCLVCGGIGKKVWKRFKGCVGLLQHSTAISKTKKKRAHKAYGQVICKVLGWDIDRLPTIVSKGETLSCSLAMLSALLGQPKGSAEGNEDDSVVVKNSVGSMDGNNGGLIGKGASAVNMNNSELMVCENSLKGDVADNLVKNLDSGVSGVEADQGAGDCQIPSKKDDSGIEADNIQGRTEVTDGLKEDETHES